MASFLARRDGHAEHTASPAWLFPALRSRIFRYRKLALNIVTLVNDICCSMAAFSRGLNSILCHHSLRLPCSLRTALFAARPQFSHLHVQNRSLPSSIIKRLASSSRPTGTLSSASYVTSDPVLRTVVQTREPVLLYTEPPVRKYLWRVYGFASLATGIGLFNFWWAKELPQELPWFVTPTYLLIGVAFCAIGVHVFQRPVRRISSMEVIPAALGGRLQLRIKARKTPFAKESVIITDIWDATISEKTNPIVAELVEADRARYQRISEGLEHMFIASRVWELAARWIEQKWTSFFLHFKFAVLQFGIARIEVEGVKWKLDCSGYLREQGSGMSHSTFKLIAH